MKQTIARREGSAIEFPESIADINGKHFMDGQQQQ